MKSKKMSSNPNSNTLYHENNHTNISFDKKHLELLQIKTYVYVDLALEWK